MKPPYGWRHYFRGVRAMYLYLRFFEYPWGRVEALREAVKFGWKP